MKPIIGLTPSWDNENKRLAIPQDYIFAVLDAGGTPVVIPSMEDADQLCAALDRCDGLLLSGGDLGFLGGRGCGGGEGIGDGRVVLCDELVLGALVATGDAEVIDGLPDFNDPHPGLGIRSRPDAVVVLQGDVAAAVATAGEAVQHERQLLVVLPGRPVTPGGEADLSKIDNCFHKLV